MHVDKNIIVVCRSGQTHLEYDQMKYPRCPKGGAGKNSQQNDGAIQTKFLNAFALFVGGIALCIACNNNNSPTQRPLIINELTLTACTYIGNDTNFNNDFYVASHLSIDSMGICRLAKRDTFLKETKYYTSVLSDTIANLINGMQFSDADTVIDDKNFSGMYCGFPYFLGIRNKPEDTSIFASLFPYALTGSYRELFTKLDRFQKNATWVSTKPFKYQNTCSFIRDNIIDTINNPLPIPRPPRKNIKFLP